MIENEIQYINLSGILNGMARLDSSILSTVRYRWLPCYDTTMLYTATQLEQVATGCYRPLQATTDLYLKATG